MVNFRAEIGKLHLKKQLKTSSYKQNQGSVLRAIFCVLLAFSLYSVSANARALDLNSLEKHLSQINSLSGDFKQTHYDSVRDQTVVSEGVFSFMKPKFMSWRFILPEPYDIILGKTKIWLFDPVLETVVVRETSQSPEIDVLFFLLNPDLLKQRFKAIEPGRNLLDIDSQSRVIYLSPIEPGQPFSELQVRFQQDKRMIDQFVIVNGNVGHRKVSLENIKINPELKLSDFEFKIPEEVEIIDNTLSR